MIVGIVLPEGHPWRSEAQAVGNVTFDRTEMADLDAAQRAPLNMLLLDSSDLTPNDIAKIRAYRMARPETRILVSLPEDAQPGSPVLAGLVSMGVYDLAQGLSLAEALARSVSFADAVRWQVADLDPETGRQKTKIEVREKIVERRVAISQRPILVAVAGTAQGVGTTSLACAIAGYLARQGHGVALVESVEPHFASVGILNGHEPAKRWVPNLVTFPSTAPNAPSPRDLVRAREYPFIVADFGAALPEEVDADLVVLCVPPEAYRYHRAAVIDVSGARFVLVGGQASEIPDVTQAFSAEYGIEVRHIPLPPQRDWPPGYKHPFAPMDDAIASLLGDLLPDQPARRRGFRLPSLKVRRPALRQSQAVTAPRTSSTGAVATQALRATGTALNTLGTILAGVLQLAIYGIEAAVILAIAGAVIWLALSIGAQTSPVMAHDMTVFNGVVSAILSHL